MAYTEEGENRMDISHADDDNVENTPNVIAPNDDLPDMSNIPTQIEDRQDEKTNLIDRKLSAKPITEEGEGISKVALSLSPLPLDSAEMGGAGCAMESNGTNVSLPFADEQDTKDSLGIQSKLLTNEKLANETNDDHNPSTPVITSISAPDLSALSEMTHSDLPMRTRAVMETPNSRRDSRYDFTNETPISASLYELNGNNSTQCQSSVTNSRSTSKAANTAKTLVSLFGGPSSIAPLNGDIRNSLAAQHDYTLVGDSPYETTYDPQSPYYYNRVYGQLYITTISVMFRGKAFGPIGAIPFERRLLLPFWEMASIEAYKTTSLKIRMEDGGQYVFKSFTNRDAVVKLMKRTRKKCCGNRSIDTDSQEGNLHHETTSSHANRSFDSYIVDGTDKGPKRRTDMERRRSSSMPSSLRGPKTSNIQTPSSARSRQNSVVFDDASVNTRNSTPKATNQNSETSSPTTERTPVLSLRLSNIEDEDDMEAPSNSEVASRRLFSTETTAASHVASIMSPPRTTILQRRQPKTPVVVVRDTNKSTSANGVNHPREGPQSSSLIVGVKATIPAIPTVPSLNTPEPHLKKKFISLDGSTNRNRDDTMKLGAFKTGSSRPNNISGNTQLSSSNSSLSTPLLLPPGSMLGLVHGNQSKTHSSITSSNVTTQKVTEVAKKSNDDMDDEDDSRIQKLWLAAKNAKTNNSQGEWKVALKTTRFSNCSLDDWFDLFFSDSAPFSLARYQIERIGDREVQFQSWRRQVLSQAEDEDRIPLLEREIQYIHPIEGGGRVVGPSEAETFRKQSLKRFGNFGAVLTNTTTVGKAVPMGDCFRVEDRWIIEQQQSKERDDPVELKVSVSFRAVFVKRTMFKSLIQKNIQSETTKWFDGYAAMMKRALTSEEYRSRRRQQSQTLVDSETTSMTGALSPSSHSTLPCDGMGMVTSEIPPTVMTEDDDLQKQSKDLDSSSEVAQLSAGESRLRGQPELPRMVWNVSLPALLVGIVTILFFWLSYQVACLGKSLVAMEQQLVELRRQNSQILLELKDLGRPAVTLTAAHAALHQDGAFQDTTIEE